MKLVGGDSGRMEHEEFVYDVVLAPSERAVVDVLFDRAGRVTRSSTARRTAPTGWRRSPSTDEPAEPPLRDPFERPAHRPRTGRRAPSWRTWLAAPPDKVLAIVAEMDDLAEPCRRDTGGLCVPDAPRGGQRRAGPLPEVRDEADGRPSDRRRSRPRHGPRACHGMDHAMHHGAERRRARSRPRRRRRDRVGGRHGRDQPAHHPAEHALEAPGPHRRRRRHPATGISPPASGSRSGWSTRWTPTTRCTTRSTSTAPAGSSSSRGTASRAEPGLEGHRAAPHRADRRHPVRRHQPRSLDGALPHRRAHALRDDVQLHRRSARHDRRPDAAGGPAHRLARTSTSSSSVGDRPGWPPPGTCGSRACVRWSWRPASELGHTWRTRWDSLTPVHPGRVRRAARPAVPGAGRQLPGQGRRRRLPARLRRRRRTCRSRLNARVTRLRQHPAGFEVHTPTGSYWPRRSSSPPARSRCPSSRRSPTASTTSVHPGAQRRVPRPGVPAGRARAGGRRRQLRLPDRRGTGGVPAGRPRHRHRLPAAAAAAARPGPVLVAHPDRA